MSELTDERVQFDAAMLALLNGFEEGETTILASRLSIINYVKAKLDELIPEGEGVVYSLSSDTNISDPLDLLINAHIDESTKDIINTAPLSVLVPTASTVTSGTSFTDVNTGYISLPSNFQRLSLLKMADWKRSITIPITPENTLYKRQSSKYTRGGTAKPVAVLTWKNISGTLTRVIEYYSVLESHVIDYLLYIPETTGEDFVTVNPNLLDSLAWMCAGKIMQITGQKGAFEEAMAQVKLSYTGLL